MPEHVLFHLAIKQLQKEVILGRPRTEAKRSLTLDMAFEARLYGYKLGHGESLNNRVDKAIESHLNNRSSI
jgi:hypothetical protein